MLAYETLNYISKKIKTIALKGKEMYIILHLRIRRIAYNSQHKPGNKTKFALLIRKLHQEK
jgi:hypothetical protein